MLDYYSFNNILSHNAVYNFVCGGRGIGKTYGWKVRVIKKALHSNDQFIYLRRYKPELAGRRTWFADVDHVFPDWDFRVNGNHAEASHASTREMDKRPWKIIGFFIPLSTAQSQKGVSFHNVKEICFDEFIIEKGHTQYLPDEAKVFSDFYSTVDRYADRVRVCFLANGISIDNPYFLKYELEPVPNKIVTKYNGFIAVEFPDSDKFKKGVLKTRFGKFINESDPDYAAYAVDNVFKDNHQMMIEKRPSSAEYYCTIECRKGSFSLWMDYESELWYFEKKRPKAEVIWTLDPNKMSEEKQLLVRSDKLAQYLRTAFRQGKARFDHPATRNIALELFK